MRMAAYDWILFFQNTEVREQTLSKLKSNMYHFVVILSYPIYHVGPKGGCPTPEGIQPTKIGALARFETQLPHPAYLW